MAVVVIVEAPQRIPTGHPKDRLRGPVFLNHLDPGHPALNARICLNVKAAVVSLHETWATIRPCVADALKVDELVPLDGFPTALVLPVTHLYDDVHGSNYAWADWVSQSGSLRATCHHWSPHHPPPVPATLRNPPPWKRGRMSPGRLAGPSPVRFLKPS